MNAERLEKQRVKTTKAQFLEFRQILGKENMPKTFAEFYDLKYNNGERFNRLKDKVFVAKKINNGNWGVTINPEKQAPHIESTKTDGKSYIYDSFDAQELFNKHYGTGRIERDERGRRTNKEVVELGYPVGINGSDGREVTAIKIHHSKKRTHIVPTRGEG